MPQVEITAMSSGPWGIAHADGRTLMVPDSIPGELVEVSVTRRRGDYAEARLERVARPAPSRRAAPCEYLPRCGGCDWQHIEYAAQAAFKAQLVARELSRALGEAIDPEGLIEPAPAEFGYRSRVRLQVGPDGALGFHERGSNRLVEVERCLVAAQALRLPHQLAKALAPRCSEIEIVENAAREVLVAHLAKEPRQADLAAAQRVLADDAAIAGIVIRGGGKREVLGDGAIELEVEPGLVLRADADLFTQVNHAQNRKLVAAVMELGGVTAGLRLLDLFCGAGNFSLPAARRGAEVLGVEADPLAAGAAELNARRYGLSARFAAMKAIDTAQFLARARYQPELIVLDPPRTGARELMGMIARLRPAAVLYVSCDLATLARDLAALSKYRYRLARVRAFDFFPNTHHVESAVRMVLT